MAKNKDFAPVEEVAPVAEPTEIRFSKEAILTFKAYVCRRDLLQALLQDGEEYTVSEVDTLLHHFMKGKVH